VAAEVQEICERYGLDYNTGPLGKQLLSVAKKICRLALPGQRDEGPGAPDAARVDTAACAVRRRPPQPTRGAPMAKDHLSKAEIRKDAVQSTVEATATAVGGVTTILTGAVRDIARTLGGFAT